MTNPSLNEPKNAHILWHRFEILVPADMKSKTDEAIHVSNVMLLGVTLKHDVEIST